jgi:ubiquinone/menaquinone biosynthesis C-methylase UbiE
MSMPTASDPAATQNGVEGARAGSWVYTYTLPIYDLGVLRLSNSYIWKCSSTHILDFYNMHISAHHLDVGVGSGYFLDACRFPSQTPQLVLADLNPDCLKVTARRIKRYQPRTVIANVLEPLGLTAAFDSVGINYVLHCLPGTMAEKSIVFANLKQVLKQGGKVFGTTILGQGVEHTAAARALMRYYNSQRLFNNQDDSRVALERILDENFAAYSVDIRGSVAFFVGQS